MLPLRSLTGEQRRNLFLNRSFGGSPINTSNNSTYARALASPMTPAIIGRPGTNHLALSRTNHALSIEELKRACGLPEPIADFILNISANDLTDDDDAAEDSNNANGALVLSTTTKTTTTTATTTALLGSTLPPTKEEERKEHLVFWPTHLRPRALIDHSIQESPSMELFLWRPRRSLHDLPTEIRLNIFEKLLEPSPSSIETIPANDPNTRVRLTIPVATASTLSDRAATLVGAKSLLLVSKLTRAEFLPLFYRRFTYKILSTPQLLSLGLAQSTMLTNPLTWANLTHLTLTTDASTSHRPRATKAFLQLCCLSLIVLPNLCTLTLTHLPAAFSPVKFRATGDSAGDEVAASYMNVFRCARLAHYGLGSRRGEDTVSVGLAARAAAAAAAGGNNNNSNNNSNNNNGGDDDDDLAAPVTSEDFLADVLGSSSAGWGVAFFKLGEILQAWLCREGVEEFELFGQVYRTVMGGGTALAVTLQTEGEWRRRARVRREKEKEKEMEREEREEVEVEDDDNVE